MSSFRRASEQGLCNRDPSAAPQDDGLGPVREVPRDVVERLLPERKSAPDFGRKQNRFGLVVEEGLLETFFVFFVCNHNVEFEVVQEASVIEIG